MPVHMGIGPLCMSAVVVVFPLALCSVPGGPCYTHKQRFGRSTGITQAASAQPAGWLALQASAASAGQIIVGPQAALRREQTVRASATCSGGWRIARWLGRLGRWVSSAHEGAGAAELSWPVWRASLLVAAAWRSAAAGAGGQDTQRPSLPWQGPHSRLRVRLACLTGHSMLAMLFCAWRRVTSCRHDLGAHVALLAGWRA